MGHQLPSAAATAVAAAAAMMIIICPAQWVPVNASDCPLDMGWSNFTLAASTCLDPNEIGKCCRYITSFVAVSVARYAHVAGRLGVPPAFSQMCFDSISKTLQMNGIPPSASMFCGLGTKVLVTYQCKGRTTVLEMMQSPNFMDVVDNCKMPLSMDSGCKRCLNSSFLYLHRLIEAEDNVTLSTCRDAVFVTLANQGDQMTAVSMASCFFGVQGLGYAEGASSPLQAPVSPAAPLLTTAAGSPPAHHLFSAPMKERHRPYQPTTIQGIGMGVFGTSVLFLMILILLIRRKSKELKDVVRPMETSRSSVTSPAQKCPEDARYASPPFMFKRFTYKETKKATCDFSTLIGKGGFGTVYKAQFIDGSMAAVKRMDKVSEQAEDDFCRELQLLARLHHRHLVSLKGFCIEKHERFLVYEYMENGSLKDHLHNPGKTSLSWQTRIQIAIDIANALEYLHFYCDPPLCHRDIKSSNILLDKDFVAKVADFGLAHASRTGSITFEPVNTDVRGTPGYMDPEYMITQELTEKSDIYSYGVLLLELVTGRRAIQENRNLVEWSQKYMITDSKLAELVDPRIVDSFDLEQLRVIGWIIRWCTQREGRARPSIKQVLRMLHERLDPVHSELARVSRDDNDDYCNFRIDKGKTHFSMMTTHTEDARGFVSSSSTTRSYCSRSFFLESGSPQSPTGHLSG